MLSWASLISVSIGQTAHGGLLSKHRGTSLQTHFFLNPLKPSFTIGKVPGQGMDEYFSTLIMPCLGEQCGSSGGGKQSDGDRKPRSGHKE